MNQVAGSKVLKCHRLIKMQAQDRAKRDQLLEKMTLNNSYAKTDIKRKLNDSKTDQFYGLYHQPGIDNSFHQMNYQSQPAGSIYQTLDAKKDPHQLTSESIDTETKIGSSQLNTTTLNSIALKPNDLRVMRNGN
jgi:hypothetical protein